MTHALPALQPRARRRKANIRRILESATALIAQQGVEALSIKKVADAADYTPGALYRYFPSKEALLAGVLAEIIEGLTDSLAAAVERTQGHPPLAGIMAQLLTYRAFARTEPHRFALLARAYGDPRVLLEDLETARVVLEAMLGALGPLAQGLEACVTAGQLHPGPAPERASLLYAGIQGVLMLRKQERHSGGIIDVDRGVVELTRAMLQGWGAPAAAVQSALTLVESIELPLGSTPS